MKTRPLPNLRLVAIALTLILLSPAGYSQTETFNSGSFIINMGATNPGTIANSIKPYGLIYDLVRNYNVPVKFIVNPTKTKDGVDFTYNAVQYKGGTFIIKSEYRSAAVNNRITYWVGQGVVGTTTTSAFSLNVTRTIDKYPRWTLDAQNGAIAEGFLLNAGINNTSFPGAYNWKPPSQLNGCDDYFVMPHADPLWSTHGNLWSWNKNFLGCIWAGCHAVSVLENMYNPANPAQQTNFLSTTGLVPFGSHGNGSPPYTHQYPTDPIAQYMGKTDLAMQNGSEQIFMPKLGGAWNPGAKIIAYDPTQADIPSKSPGPAVAIIYGRGMDDPGRGFVMYEAAHSINKGTVNDAAAQRAFFNFSFCNAVIKNPVLTVTGITEGMQVQSGATITGLNVVATSPMAGATFTYQWSSGCGGSFSNPTAATTNFTAPTVAVNTTCTITCRVTDNCGRSTFETFIVIIMANHPPVAVNDAQTIDPGCGNVSLTYNVLSNDSDVDGQPLTLTSVTGAVSGSMGFTSSGNITYTPNPGFFGMETLNYTICDNTSPAPLCASGTYTITVGNIANVPNAANDAITIEEDIEGRFNVLANDVPVVSGPLTVSGITSPPSNGRVSINTDNTITYIPNPDFAGTDNFTYRLVNSVGYSKTATVTVTVTNNTCDGGTYQVVAPVNGNISPNPTIDTYLSEQNTGRNYGTCTTFLVDGQNGARAYRGLLKFDLTSIPANAVINSATLTLVATAVQSNNSFPIDVHRMTRDWAEGAQCNTNGTPSWNQFSAGNSWTTLGGDFDATVQGTTNVSTTGTYNWSLSSLVQNWVNGTNPNYGLLMKFTTENTANEQKSFGSLQNATIANRPVLAISYTVPAQCSAIPNRAPIAMPDTSTTPNGVMVNINTAANDYFPVAGAKTYSIVTPPASGIASINPATGVISYTPNTTYNGVRSMTYRVLDNTSGLADTAYAYVNITNGPIVANDDYPVGALSSVAQTINVKANDTDPENPVLGATYTVTIVTAPQNGTASVDGSGNIIYAPDNGFTGNDTLYYLITEPAPACGTPFRDTAMVVIVVINRPPTPGDDTKDGPPCHAITVNLLTNDTDPEGNTLTVTNISALNPPAAGTLTNNNDGTVTFTPATGFTGTVTFTYTVTDNGVPPQTSGPATVTINISNPVNTPPVAVNDVETIEMDQTLYENVRDNDYDPDNNDLTNPVITVAPLHGTATVNPVNGLIQYTPNPGYFGTDVLTYQICDILTLNVATCTPGIGACATATLTINIVIPNTTYAVNDENSTWINTAVSGVTLINDYDLEADPLVFSGFIDNSGSAHVSGSITVSGNDVTGAPVANAGSLSISATGAYTYTPAAGFTGNMTVPYLVSDNNENPASDTGYLVITVNPLRASGNSTIANNDEEITYGAAISRNVLVNDRDPQANSFTVSAFSYDGNGDGQTELIGSLGIPVNVGGQTTTGRSVSNAGSFVIGSNGAYSFTPATDFHGSVNISYTICDNYTTVACATALLHIEVLPNGNGAANDPPFGGDDFGYTAMNIPVSGNFASNDQDPNGNPMSLQGVTINTAGPHTFIQTRATTQGGTVDFYSDGTYTYTPPSNYTGPDLVTYSLCDVTGVAPQPVCAGVSLHFLITVGSILPLNLLDFNGKLNAGKVELYWKTSSEINTDHFVAERSNDGVNFISIGTVKASGSLNTIKDYNLIDPIPANGANYYRLKMYDKDGSFVYSKIVIIRMSNALQLATQVRPNPFSSYVDVYLTLSHATPVEFRIIDMTGKAVFRQSANGYKGFNWFNIRNLDKLSSAVYMLNIITDTDNIVEKLIKQ